MTNAAPSDDDLRRYLQGTLSEAEESRERLFPQWDMELVSGEHISDVLADALAEERDPHDEAALRALLNEVNARGSAAPLPAAT